MRAILRGGREVSNRDFEMSDRTRIDHYRGRKDSALALHYLWRVGEAMVTRRDRFERVYALTEAVAPAWALREVDDAEADDRLLLKAVAADGLARLAGINTAYVNKLKAEPAAAGRVARSPAGGRVAHRGPGRGLADAPARARRGRGDPRASSRRVACRPPGRRSTRRPTDEATFLSPLDPVSARGRAKPLFGFDYVWEVYKPVEQRRFGYYTMPILWGDRLVGRFDPKLDRSTGTLMILGLWLEDAALREGRGVRRRAGGRDAAVHDACSTSAGSTPRAVPQPAIRRALAGLGVSRRRSGPSAA